MVRLEYRECCICGVSNKEKKVRKSSKYGMICDKHYCQMEFHGKIINYNQRGIQDRNKFIEREAHYDIELYDKHGNVSGYCKISKKHYDVCKRKKWRLWKDSVMTGNNINGNEITNISRYLYEHEFGAIKEGYVIDHINSDRLDNRIENLRETTQDKNCFNKSYMSNNKSGILGVRYDASRDRYVVEVGSNRVGSKIGRFRFGRNDTKYIDAVYIRYLCEINIFGEFRSEQNNKEFYDAISELTDDRIIELNKYFGDKFLEKYNRIPKIDDKNTILKLLSP